MGWRLCTAPVFAEKLPPAKMERFAIFMELSPVSIVHLQSVCAQCGAKPRDGRVTQREIVE